jgi:GNAT superfamily N-acetyltransferase
VTDRTVVVRPRRADDIPVLAEVLFAQQAESRYPFRDPLPFPVEQFLHADDAQAAWTAEVDGRIVGHVCRIGPPHGFVDAAPMNEACATAHGRPVDELSWVSTLFVAAAARGTGTGRRLLEAVVDDIRSEGLAPCLEVLLTHAGAYRLYRSTGWQEVMRLQPRWLLDAAAATGEVAPEVVVMVLPASSPAAGSGRSPGR